MGHSTDAVPLGLIAGAWQLPLFDKQSWLFDNVMESALPDELRKSVWLRCTGLWAQEEQCEERGMIARSEQILAFHSQEEPVACQGSEQVFFRTRFRCVSCVALSGKC